MTFGTSAHTRLRWFYAWPVLLIFGAGFAVQAADPPEECSRGICITADDPAWIRFGVPAALLGAAIVAAVAHVRARLRASAGRDA